MVATRHWKGHVSWLTSGIESIHTFSTIFGSATSAILGATGNSYFWRKGSTHFRSRLARQSCVVAARRSRSFATLSFVFWFSFLYYKKIFVFLLRFHSWTPKRELIEGKLSVQLCVLIASVLKDRIILSYTNYNTFKSYVQT